MSSLSNSPSSPGDVIFSLTLEHGMEYIQESANCYLSNHSTRAMWDRLIFTLINTFKALSWDSSIYANLNLECTKLTRSLCCRPNLSLSLLLSPQLFVCFCSCGSRSVVLLIIVTRTKFKSSSPWQPPNNVRTNNLIVVRDKSLLNSLWNQFHPMLQCLSLCDLTSFGTNDSCTIVVYSSSRQSEIVIIGVA